jgi:integrase/recombinase XerD
MTDVELFDAFATYQRSRAFSENTVSRRQTSLGRFAKFMTPKSVTSASWEDVEEWIGSHQTPGTRHAYRSDLCAFFKWASRRGLIDGNPMPLVDPVRVPKTLPKPAPEDAIATAFTLADGDTQVMILLAALAGLRRAEIAALEQGDVYLDVEPAVLHVRCGKGAKDRVVPVHPTLAEHLKRRACWLYRPRSQRFSARAVGARLANALSRDGQRITGHQLRHYFGTEAARWSGGNVVLVSQLMGHSNMNTTMGYIRWSPSEGADVVSKIVTIGVDDELTVRRLRSA